jgi:UV DNA damage endonuclease
MRIGYPCINSSIDCTANSTFRLKNYSEERLTQTVSANLDCLARILQFNLEHGLLFFRISSDVIPFASHPQCSFNWQRHFKDRFKAIGAFIKKNGMRVSMHPDQFVLLNALSPQIVENSIAELRYHADFLDSLGAELNAKIQIHVGGVYGDKPASIRRFIDVYESLPPAVARRLVIENDERLFCLADCLEIHRSTKVPIVLDVFHHALFNRRESIEKAMADAGETWRNVDGVPIVDYSSQAAGARTGAHTDAIDIRDFAIFVNQSRAFDFDIMLEIKDKEKSAIKALHILTDDRRIAHAKR